MGSSGQANALLSVVFASCYNGDTCSTTEGESIRLACIDTPELSGSKAEVVPAKVDHNYFCERVV
ncbi:hypothetical protein [Synechococcus sp. LTW-R]|uniref:hypothetical protein n=1 Tax=Synechococcus sp. LTW-R TaxID=2751170 RepID=UPI001623DFD5|nr:hypothetical protein [Synechococcus sp. LTW-R]QNG30331.1 hypothetical protein H0O22_04220 [Synechococcus sp. LTW-R]